MSSINSIRIAFSSLQSRAFGSITGTYAVVGAAFTNPARLIKITNTTDQNILISFNGLDDNDILPAGSAQIYDYGTNRSSNGSTAEQPLGTQVFVKAETSNPGSGSVYVTVIYLSES